MPLKNLLSNIPLDDLDDIEETSRKIVKFYLELFNDNDVPISTALSSLINSTKALFMLMTDSEMEFTALCRKFEEAFKILADNSHELLDGYFDDSDEDDDG